MQDTRKGESNPMERGGDKGGEGGTCGSSASTNLTELPPPSTQSGKICYTLSQSRELRFSSAKTVHQF